MATAAQRRFAATLMAVIAAAQDFDTPAFLYDQQRFHEQLDSSRWSANQMDYVDGASSAVLRNPYTLAFDPYDESLFVASFTALESSVDSAVISLSMALDPLSRGGAVGFSVPSSIASRYLAMNAGRASADRLRHARTASVRFASSEAMAGLPSKAMLRLSDFQTRGEPPPTTTLRFGRC